MVKVSFENLYQAFNSFAAFLFAPPAIDVSGWRSKGKSFEQLRH